MEAAFWCQLSSLIPGQYNTLNSIKSWTGDTYEIVRGTATEVPDAVAFTCSLSLFIERANKTEASIDLALRRKNDPLRVNWNPLFRRARPIISFNMRILTDHNVCHSCLVFLVEIMTPTIAYAFSKFVLLFRTRRSKKHLRENGAHYWILWVSCYILNVWLTLRDLEVRQNCIIFQL
jgi:hypothetical protein